MLYIILGGKQMDKTKKNFFWQLKIALLKPTQYYQFSKISGGRLIGFVFLFILLTSLLSILPDSVSLLKSANITKVLDENVPDFKLSHGELQMERRYDHYDGFTHVVIDASVDSFTFDDINTSYDSEILVSKTNAIYYQPNRTQEIKFSDLGNITFDKSMILAFAPLIYVIFFLAFILIYLFNTGFYFATALLYSLVGLIVVHAAHIKLPYSRIYKISIYSKVCATLISLVLPIILRFTSLNLRGYYITLIGIVVTCSYVVYGTLSHINEEPPTQSPQTMLHQ